MRINGRARIICADLECTNGYAHLVDRVITPAPNTLSQLIAETGNLKIFNHLLETTSWADSLLKYRDRNYVQPGESYAKYRLYGYMAFTETDEVFHREWGVPLPVTNEETGGVTNWEEIMATIRQRCAEAYPEATGKDPYGKDNAVNKFVAYHLVPFRMPYDKLTIKENVRGYTSPYDGLNIIRLKIDPINTWSYYPTMGKPTRLLKITETAMDGVRHINRHSFYDNSFSGDYHEWGCDMEGITLHEDNGKWENYCTNGIYYPIDNILIYSTQVRDVVLNERLRYNITQSQPETINSNLLEKAAYITKDFCKNFVVNDEGKILLYASPGWSNYNYSPRLLTTYARDYSFKLLPVPFSGNWEVRLRAPAAVNENIAVR